MVSSVTASSQQAAISTYPSSRTFDKIMEKLSPGIVAENEKKATLWNVASIVSTIAFFALALGIFIGTGILFPPYLPLAGLTALLLAMPAVGQIKKFTVWSSDAQLKAKKYQTLQGFHANLSQKTPAQLQRSLLKMGIVWNQIPGIRVNHPEDLQCLTPLLAQAKHLKKKTNYWISKRDEYGNQARLAPSHTDEKAIARHTALRCEDVAIQTKVRSAFIHAVLRKPNFNGVLNELGSFSENTYSERTLGNALNDSTANTIFSFNNSAISKITYDEVNALSVAQLGQRFFEVMTTLKVKKSVKPSVKNRSGFSF